MDNELSVRAGLNVGIEPTLLPFVQAGAGDVKVLQYSDVVVAQYSKNAARVLFAQGRAGYLFNTGPSDASVDLMFVDEFGNMISLTGGVPVPVLANSAPVLIQIDGTFEFFCLAAGEMIVARAAPYTAGPTQDVTLDGDPVVEDGEQVII